MLKAIKFLIVFFWCYSFMTNSINAQDIEVELPDYLKPTSTTTTSTTTTTTEVPPETTTQAPPTLADTTTDLPSTNILETTTPISQDTTTTTTITTITGRPIVPRPTPTIPTWIPPPTVSHKPHYPHHWGNRCYYKEQHGMGHLKWFCGHLRWVYSVDCFHCCYYDFSSFAGCSKVSHHYCAHYID